MSGLKSVVMDKGETAVEMKVQLEQAKTDDERQRIANSDLYSVADIDGKSIFYHEALWVKVNGKPIPNGMLVFHKDGNPMNNDPDNLDIVKENENYGDLHSDENKVFHEHNYKSNEEFIKEHFDDIYCILFE